MWPRAQPPGPLGRHRRWAGDRDEATFDEHEDATNEPAVRPLHAMVDDLGEAEDVAQEAYGRTGGRWPQLATMADRQPEVRTVAWRLALDRWRRLRGAARRPLLRAPARPASALPVESVAVVEALRHLPADQRRVIVLHHLADLSVEQVAVRTGASVSAVESRLRRGRAALAALLEDTRSVQPLAEQRPRSKALRTRLDE